MKISVLDYGVIDQNRTAQEALQDTCRLAKTADDLGFHRFWLAEHHNVHAFSISSPELMMVYLAGQTKRIRLGSGGIMALHYSSYKLAEVIKTLTALYPNRIDIGLGNNLGTPAVHQAMASIHQKNDYFDVLEQLKKWLTKEQAVTVQPRHSYLPEVFPLSNSLETAEVAGKLGLGYVFGVFPYVQKNPVDEAQKVADTYFKTFQPSALLPKANLLLAVFVCIAETAAEAERFARILDIWMLGKQDFNAFSSYPDSEAIVNYPLTDTEKKVIAANRSRFLVGTKDTIQKALKPLLEASKASEILFIPLIPKLSNRIKALELLASIY